MHGKPWTEGELKAIIKLNEKYGHLTYRDWDKRSKEFTRITGTRRSSATLYFTQDRLLHGAYIDSLGLDLPYYERETNEAKQKRGNRRPR